MHVCGYIMLYLIYSIHIQIYIYRIIYIYIQSHPMKHSNSMVFKSRQAAPELPSEWSITDQIPGSDQLSASRATELSRHSIRGAERATLKNRGKSESGSFPRKYL